MYHIDKKQHSNDITLIPTTFYCLGDEVSSLLFYSVFQTMELLVLNKLKWDLSAITPHDFLEQILSRIPMETDLRNSIKRHAQIFIALCAKGNYYFFIYKSSECENINKESINKKKTLAL